MKISHCLITGTVGTSAMTLFSYWVAASKEKKFEEPELLAELVEKITKEEQVAKISGWLMHYATGCMMAFAFHQIWKTTRTRPGVGQSLLAGLWSGIIGIGIWKMVFSMHPNPPKIPFRRYYGHLLLAHLVFAAGVVGTKRSMDSTNQKTVHRKNPANIEEISKNRLKRGK